MLFLDEDPSACADSTPISLHRRIILELKEAFEYVDANSDVLNWSAHPTSARPLMRLFVNDIIYSKANRDWLVAYYNNLAFYSIKYSNEHYLPIKCTFVPKKGVGEYYSRALKIHSPVYDSHYSQLVLDNNEIYKDIPDIVDLSRVMLMQLGPTDDEFPAGLPVWIESSEQNTYTAFDPIRKLHIKIVRNSTGYRYYTSYISNNWKEIKGVPKEMDALIDCLIST